MAKELPYFKFFPGEWTTGDITILSMEAQGLFINICAFYWMRLGDLTLTHVQQRFNTCSAELNELLESDIFEFEDDKIVVKFLDEQFLEFERLRNKKSRAGKASAKLRKVNTCSTPVQQNSNKEDKDKDKDKEKIKIKNIGTLTDEINILYPNPNDFEKTEIDNFISYWTEPNKSGSKLRYQIEKTWDTKRRLNTWFTNSEKFNPRQKDSTSFLNLTAEDILKDSKNQ